MKEIKCKYKNELNRLNMNGWTTAENNLFFLILAKAKNQGTRTVCISRDEILEYLDLKIHPARIEDNLDKTLTKFMSLTFVKREHEDNAKTIKYQSIFSQMKIRFEDDGSDVTLYVKLDENYEYLLNFFDKGGFTVFELKEYLSLDSFYSKQAYKMIKQYRTQGFTQVFPMKEFRELFCIPASYQPKQITAKVLSRIETELKPIFPGLKIEQLHDDKKQKQRTTGYRFKFTPEKTLGPYEPGKPKTKRKSQKASLPEWYYKEDPGKADAETVDELKALLEKPRVQVQKKVQDAGLDEDDDDGMALFREAFGSQE